MNQMMKVFIKEEIYFSYEIPCGIDRKLVSDAHEKFLAPFFCDEISSWKIPLGNRKLAGKLIGETPNVEVLLKDDFFKKWKSYIKKTQNQKRK